MNYKDLTDYAEIVYDVRTNMKLIALFLESWEDLMCGHCEFTENMRATLRFMLVEHITIYVDKLSDVGDSLYKYRTHERRKKLRLRRVVEHSKKRNYNDSRTDKE